MRNLVWVVFGIMILAGLGNIIGGTDTPVTASVSPAVTPARVQTTVPAVPQFDATLFVSANSLNLREAPNTRARVLTTLPRNTQVLAGERQGNWVLVSSNGQVGWVSGDYLSGTRGAPVVAAPAQSVPRQQVVQQQSAGSCPSRRYCTQIGSCQEAQFYLANCSWGHKLDSDSDGVPCESMCR